MSGRGSRAPPHLKELVELERLAGIEGVDGHQLELLQVSQCRRARLAEVAQLRAGEFFLAHVVVPDLHGVVAVGGGSLHLVPERSGRNAWVEERSGSSHVWRPDVPFGARGGAPSEVRPSPTIRASGERRPWPSHPNSSAIVIVEAPEAAGWRTRRSSGIVWGGGGVRRGRAASRGNSAI